MSSQTRKGICAYLPYQIQDVMWGSEQLNDASRQKTLTAAAQVLCDMCPLRQSCLVDALCVDEQFGVFGGLRVRARRRLAQIAAMDGITPGTSRLQRERMVHWLATHPEMVEQVRLQQSQDRAAERIRASQRRFTGNRVISFIGPAGTGKTVSVFCTAVALARAGYSVSVWDMDPKATITRWVSQCEQDTGFTVQQVSADALPDVDGTGFILIDTPNAQNASLDELTAAIDASSLVIITSDARPQSLKDVWYITHHIHRPSTVLLNVRREDAKQTQTWMREHHMCMCNTVIHRSRAYEQALHNATIPDNIAQYAVLAREISDVFEHR